jgi:hypothetical protein
MTDWDADGEPIPVERVGTRPDTGEAGADGQRAPERDDAEREDLVAEAAELEETLRTLREEIDSGGARRPPGRRSGDGPGRRDRPALPRPPTPREVLRFTENYTIPTVIAVLEASIRALELLGATIRLLDGRDPRSGRGSRPGEGLLSGLDGADARDRAVETGRTALERVDTALAELQRAYEGEPEDERAQELLADARTLRSEIDDRLRDLSADEREDSEGGNGEGGDREAERDEEADSEGEQAAVDVEAELETLRRDLGRDDADGPGGNDPEPTGDGDSGSAGDDDSGTGGSAPDT